MNIDFLKNRSVIMQNEFLTKVDRDQFELTKEGLEIFINEISEIAADTLGDKTTTNEDRKSACEEIFIASLMEIRIKKDFPRLR